MAWYQSSRLEGTSQIRATWGKARMEWSIPNNCRALSQNSSGVKWAVAARELQKRSTAWRAKPGTGLIARSSMVLTDGLEGAGPPGGTTGITGAAGPHAASALTQVVPTDESSS